MKNPVMFVVEIGAFLTLAFVIRALMGESSSQVSTGYFVALDIWLFLTVIFANFATAFAEERGKAQAESLRKTRVATPAYRLRDDGKVEEVSSIKLVPGDRVVVTTGQVIPGDGEVIEGFASVDEAAITGESAPRHQRVRRRPLGRHRRHHGPVRPDDFLAEATPEMKLAYLRKEQAEGKLVAMMGDGTNDAPLWRRPMSGWR
jgi:high-affinity K+ transport system ATPase subunit B